MTSEEISSIKFPGIKVPLQGATLRIFNNEEEVHEYINKNIILMNMSVK